MYVCVSDSRQIFSTHDSDIWYISNSKQIYLRMCNLKQLFLILNFKVRLTPLNRDLLAYEKQICCVGLPLVIDRKNKIVFTYYNWI